MKKLLTTLFLLFALIPNLSFAETNNKRECGEIRPETSEGYFDLCKEDSINDLFSIIFPYYDELNLNYLKIGSEEKNEAAIELKKESKFSKIFHYFVLKFNNIIFYGAGLFIIIFLLVESVATYRTENISNYFKYIGTAFLVAILTFPVPSFNHYSLAQIASISFVKNSVSIANYVNRKFLQFMNFDTNEADVSSQRISVNTKAKGQQLTEMALCGVRTKRAKQQNYFGLLDDNPLGTFSVNNLGNNLGSVFTSSTGDIDDEITSYDFANVQKQLNSCFGNKYSATKKDNALTFLGYEGVDSCHFGGSTVDTSTGEEKVSYGFNEDKFGYGYDCGAIYYSDTDITSKLDNDSNNVDSNKFDQVNEQIEEDSLAIVSTYNNLSFTMSLISKLENIVAESASQQLDEDQTLAKLNEAAAELSNDLESKTSQLAKRYESKLKSTVSKQRTRLLNIYYSQLHKKALKAMLGGNTYGDFYEDKQSNNNNIKYLLNEYSLNTAKYLNAANCYKNVDDYRTISAFNLADLQNDKESIQKLQEGFGTNTFECLNTEMMYGNSINVDLVGTALDMPSELATIRTYFDEHTNLIPNYQAAQNAAVSHLNKKARQYQSVLNAYLYVTEKATADSLARTLKKAVDKDGLTLLSKNGILGTITLQYNFGAYSSNASQQVQSLSEIFSVDNGSNGSTTNYLNNQADNFIALQAFAEEDKPMKTIESQIADKNFNFNFINVNSFFAQKNSYSVSDQDSAFEKTKRQNDDIADSDFIKAIKELFLSPTDSFRKNVGAVKGQSLNERVNECEQQDLDFLCIENLGNTSYSLQEFGSKSISAYIAINLIDKGADSLSGLSDDYDNDSANKKKKKGLKSYIIKGIGLTILAVSVLAKMLLAVAVQISPILLMIGIFMGYIVPFIPVMRFFVEIIIYALLAMISIFTIPLVIITGFLKRDLNFKPVVNSYITLLLHLVIITILYCVGTMLFSIFTYLIYQGATSILNNSSTDITDLLINNIMAWSFIAVLSFFAVLKIFDFAYWSNMIYKSFGVAGLDHNNESMAFERLIQAGAIGSVVTNTTDIAGDALNKTTTKARNSLRNVIEMRRNKRNRVLDELSNSVESFTTDKKEEEKKEDNDE